MKLGHFAVFHAALNPSYRPRKLFTLEAPTRGDSHKFEQLIGTKIFDYLVTPDLPRSSTWRDLVRWTDPTPCPSEAIRKKGLMTVKTIAAQVHSEVFEIVC